MTMRNLQISESAESRHVSICSSHPTSQIKTDLPQPAQISCWLLRFLQKHEITKYCRGVGSSEWLGQLRESGRRHPSSTASHQQSHQPQAESTDPKTSANLGVTSTLSRSSIVRTPDLRTSCSPQRNSKKTSSVTFSKEPPLLSTSSFWVWMAPSTTFTL